MTTPRKTSAKAAEAPQETTVALRTPVGEDVLASAKAIREQARQAYQDAVTAYEEIEQEDIDPEGLHADVDVALFLANGRHEVRVKKATAAVERAERTKTKAEKEHYALYELATPDSLRFAELAAEQLRPILVRIAGGQYIGRVYVEPAKVGRAADHAGNREGGVRVIVEESPLSAPLLYPVMQEALNALGGGKKAVVGDRKSYVYGYAGVLTDPVLRSQAEARRAADKRYREALSYGPINWDNRPGGTLVVP